MSIELEHSFDVPIPPDQAWDVLLDVQRVAPCMPGATVESVEGDEVSGRIKVKVGPIALTYTGKAAFTERDEARRSVRIEAAGKEAKGAGTASATVVASLNEENGTTQVNVHTTLNVTGRPAQFGRGVMAEVSGKIIDKFAANLAGQLAAVHESEPARPDGQAPDSRLATPLQELNLPARTLNILKGEGIDTVGALASRTESELLSIRNLGAKSVSEIGQRLSDLGLALAGPPEAGHAEPAGARLAGAEPGAAARPAAAGVPADSTARAHADGAAGAAAERAAAAPPAGTAGDGSRPVTEAGDQVTALPRDEDAGLARDEPGDDALNLLDVAAGPILKRALPAAAAAVVLIWVGTRIRLHGRRGQAAGRPRP
jgi:carbon monoxide dehydrogenase subunit G